MTVAPTSTDVALRAYREALAAGDETLADRAAAVLARSPAAPGDLPLFALAGAARSGNRGAADAAIVRLATGPFAILAPSLHAWSVFVGGGDAVAAIDAAGMPRATIAGQLAVETRALMLIARGDTAAGLAAIAELRTQGTARDLRIAAAQLLFGQGRADASWTLLKGSDPLYAAMRAGVPAKPTLAFGVSRLLARIASDLESDAAAGAAPSQLSIALAANALRADPRNDGARLLLATALARGGATDRALAVLDGVAASSAYADSTVGARIAILGATHRSLEALALARRGAERPGAAATDRQRYADQLVAANRYADAASWYRRIAAADPNDWAAWLQYGAALDRAGQWPPARAALGRAVALAPAQPLALNYLGYAELERRENVRGATAMLERARALKPDDASIADSLGWAYRLGGDSMRALPLLERAAAAAPANSEIGDHLGDTYWAVGRRYEARYAWRAAIVTADAVETARIAGKLAHGPPPRP